jgi:hypothetical protein
MQKKYVTGRYQRRKKALASILVSSCLVLSGCGGGSDSEPTAVPPVVEPPPPSPPQPPEPPTEPESNLPKALESGDASLLNDDDEAELFEEILGSIDELQTVKDNTLGQIWQDETIVYAPGNRTQIFTSTNIEANHPLIVGNKGRNLAMAGVAGNSRFIAFGEGIFREMHEGRHLTLAEPSKRMLSWITELDNPNEALKVSFSYFGNLESGNKAWLAENYDQWVFSSCNDSTTLDSCFQEQDLIILGWNQSDNSDTSLTADAIEKAKEAGTPIIYLHDWYEAKNEVVDAIGNSLGITIPYGGNFWANDAADWSNSEAMSSEPDLFDRLSTMVTHLRDDSFAIDWAGCRSSVGKVICHEDENLQAQFLQAAQSIRDEIMAYDMRNQHLFATQERPLLKRLILLGDRFRQRISYPLDKESSSTLDFLQAYYADHAVYYSRSINQAQTDLGNFSSVLSADEQNPSTSNTTVITNAFNEYTSTGYYALPGETLTISRTDSSTTAVSIFINPQRTGSTREFNTNQYLRPKFLKTPLFVLNSASEITITSPYGGPIFIQTPSTDVAQDVQLALQNVVSYPLLSDLSNGAAFLNDLDETALSWSGIKTDFIEINSPVDMTTQFLRSERYQGDAESAMSDLQKYMIEGTYNLAGFAGEGLSLSEEMLSFCTNKAWDCSNEIIHAKPKRQHINVDRHAHCGGGCSGNPYDQAWVISPFGWGETHEIGHNLQRARLKLYDGRSTEVSNNIFPLYKGWQRYQDTDEVLEYCDSRPNSKATFDMLIAAQSTEQPKQAIYDTLWSQTGIYDNAFERLSVYAQIALHANQLEQFSNGWEVFTAMYLHERLFSTAFGNVDTWNEQKQALGFDTYEIAPRSIGANDFMLISLSFVTEQDQRPFFDMWGIDYTDTASAQVAAYDYAAVERLFFASSNVCTDLEGQAVEVNSDAVWP